MQGGKKVRRCAKRERERGGGERRRCVIRLKRENKYGEEGMQEVLCIVYT